MGQSSRTTVRRLPERGVYGRESINAILDEALICHVGFVDGGQPFVIPTIHVRLGDQLYLHGSRASRMLKCLSTGIPACVTVTLLDGIVVARSAFHSSMNYRSVVVLGAAREVTDATEKWTALERLVEHVIPGRWSDLRQPTENEMNATTVVAMAISEASAKVRAGPPKDDEDDYALSFWAGLIPVSLKSGQPQPDPKLPATIPVPNYVREYRCGQQGP